MEVGGCEGVCAVAFAGQADAFRETSLSGAGGRVAGGTDGEHPLLWRVIASIGSAKRGWVRIGQRPPAASKLGLEAVPILVREMSDDEAVILMVDRNLQREHLLTSEKAFAYKMKLEALKHQGKAALSRVATKSGKADTASVIGEQAGESRDQVFRYIRLTNLVPPLLKLVDEGCIAFSPAVELSYLTKEEQAELWT